MSRSHLFILTAAGDVTAVLFSSLSNTIVFWQIHNCVFVICGSLRTPTLCCFQNNLNSKCYMAEKPQNEWLSENSSLKKSQTYSLNDPECVSTVVRMWLWCVCVFRVSRLSVRLQFVQRRLSPLHLQPVSASVLWRLQPGLRPGSCESLLWFYWVLLRWRKTFFRIMCITCIFLTLM